MAHHSRKLFPKKGTRARKALLKMLSTKGLTAQEAIGNLGYARCSFGYFVSAYAFERGWDIRSFPVSENDRRLMAYRFVGFYGLDDKYRSLLKVAEYA